MIKEIDRKDVKKYMEDIIFDGTIQKQIITDRYHHNVGYDNAPSVIKHGILSVSDQHKKGIVKYTSETLKMLDDVESHVNGNNAISLAVVGLTDLYRDEIEFNPFRPHCVDFIVSDSVKASRITTHYGNEFLSYNPIESSMLKAVDVRILEYFDILSKMKNVDRAKIISVYESLRKIAISLKENKVNIPLREMSNGNNTLDTSKIIEMPKLVLK